MNSARAFIFLTMLIVAGGCAQSRKAVASSPLSPPPEKQHILQLIDQLAIDDSPDRVTPEQARAEQERAYRAYDALRAAGPAAWPYLIESFDDDRFSIALIRVWPPSVGLACWVCVTGQIYALPPEYQQTASIMRVGKDGKEHRRPIWGDDMFKETTVAEWLQQRNGNPLEALQLEAIEWVLAREEAIGVRNASEKRKFLHPLRSKRDELKRKVAALQPR